MNNTGEAQAILSLDLFAILMMLKLNSLPFYFFLSHIYHLLSHFQARGMIDNFLLDMVGVYGHMPNGGRLYYVARSQPPMLTMMVQRLYTATRDRAWLTAAMPLLAQEYSFWMRERSITFSGA